MTAHDARLDLAVDDPLPALPRREAFVSAYCETREVSAEHAGKLYDLLAAEPAWHGAVLVWASQFMRPTEVRQ